MKPEGVKSDVQVLPDGTIIQPEVYLEQYSERQIKAAIEYEKSQNRVNAYIEQGQKEEAEAISKGRAAIAKALKNTAEYQITALRNERDILIADIDKSIEAYKAQGKDTSSLLADRDKVIQVYNQKIEDAGKKGAKSAKSAAVSQADYNGELERTRQTIDSLQQQLGLDKTEDLARAKIRIEQQYQATLSKTNEELTKQVAQGKLTQGQADTLQAEKAKAAELQKQVALRDAEQKAQERQYKDLQAAANFYKELGNLSGEYGESLEYQNRVLEHEASIYRDTLPAAMWPYVDEWLRLKQLQNARDPFSGMVRGARKWAAETTDYASSVEQALTGTFDRATDAFAEFALTGKMNLADLGNYFLQTLAVIGARNAIGGIVGGLTSALGGIMGGFFGGGGITTKTTGSTWSSGISYENTRPGGWHRGGLVGIDSPTFTRSLPLMAFEGAPRLHSGGGWFAQDEYPAILQRGERVLNRDETAAYHAGMAAGGNRGNSSDKEPAVYVTINNTTGEPVSTQRSRDGNGNTNIEVLVGNVVAKQLTSPGSNLNRAVRATTGARQSVIGR